jgi:hypothetical protein
MISRRTHGILDYVVGLILILAPSLLGLQPGSPEARVPFLLGWAALIYSVLTRYELGLIKVLPFKLHLGLDMLSGIFLALSPWLLGFSDRVWLPHLLLGLVEIGAVLMTRARSHQHAGIGATPAH